jgi:hypothetical protein
MLAQSRKRAVVNSLSTEVPNLARERCQTDAVTSAEWAPIAAAGGAVLGAAVAGVITYFVTTRQMQSAKEEGRLQRG